MIIALLLAATAPSPEAVALGRQLSETGTLAAVLPLIQAKETAELVAAHPELSDAEKLLLQATAAAVYAKGRDRLMEATARAYAERLSVEDLQALVTFHATPAAANFRRVTPEVIAATMQAVGPMDYKKDVRTAFCKESGKLCDAD